jgi:hypothetical protein
MILSCSQFWVIITWFGRLELLVLVLVWLGKTEQEMVQSLESVLELGIKLDLVLKPELEPNLDQNQNWFFSQIMLLGTKSSFKSVRDI